MADIKRGFVFTHKHFLDPNYRPNVEAGEKYATGPKATMVVTRATRTTVYFKHGDNLQNAAGGSWYLPRAEFETTYGAQR